MKIEDLKKAWDNGEWLKHNKWEQYYAIKKLNNERYINTNNKEHNIEDNLHRIISMFNEPENWKIYEEPKSQYTHQEILNGWVCVDGDYRKCNGYHRDEYNFNGYYLRKHQIAVLYKTEDIPE